MKLKNAVMKYRAIPVAAGLVSVGLPMTAFAADATPGTLADTLGVFSDVFAWFLEEGGNLLSWMLGKPIILLSLSVFFVGAVVGMLSRIYSSF